MINSVPDTFIAGLEPRFASVVRAIDAAAMSVRPDFSTRIYYKMLTYSLPGNRPSEWMFAIGATSKLVNLRFLYGFLFDDPRGVLRAGTGILRTIDFAPGQEVDAHLVTDYVQQAVDKLPAFKAYERDQKKKA